MDFVRKSPNRFDAFSNIVENQLVFQMFVDSFSKFKEFGILSEFSEFGERFNPNSG